MAPRNDPPTPADLTISLSSRADGRVIFRCTRADGSATWQRHEGPRARFFPFHDLSHYSVESVLGARDGFYGLIAAGWDIDDTGGKGAKGPIPPEGILVEHIVGLFDREGIGGSPLMTAEEMLAHLESVGVASSFGPITALTSETLAAVRAERERVFSLWAGTPSDATMELTFLRPNVSRLSRPMGSRAGR